MALTISCKKEPINDKPDDTDNSSVPMVSNIPNGDFEQWALSAENTYEEPSTGWWTSLNVLKNLGGPETLLKTNDKHTGAYAAKLETKAWDNLMIPGLLLTGTFDFAAPNMVIQGKPFTEKPLKLKGYYKYTSVNADSAAIYANVTHYNEQTHQKDTIGEARFAVLSTVGTYTLFEIDFTYFYNDIAPDSLSIVFASSADGANFNGQQGSTLFIDDVSLVLPGNKILKLH